MIIIWTHQSGGLMPDNGRTARRGPSAASRSVFGGTILVAAAVVVGTLVFPPSQTVIDVEVLAATVSAVMLALAALCRSRWLASARLVVVIWSTLALLLTLSVSAIANHDVLLSALLVISSLALRYALSVRGQILWMRLAQLQRQLRLGPDTGHRLT